MEVEYDFLSEGYANPTEETLQRVSESLERAEKEEATIWAHFPWIEGDCAEDMTVEFLLFEQKPHEEEPYYIALDGTAPQKLSEEEADRLKRIVKCGLNASNEAHLSYVSHELFTRFRRLVT